MVKKFTVLIFALNCLFISAQVKFDATVSKNKLGLNERLRVDFVMNQNGDNFSPPDFENFRIIGGPNQSIKSNYVNGESSFSKTYSYFLQPLRKGSLRIKQASIEIDGEEYKSLPIEVIITDSVDQPSDSVTQYYNDEDIELRALISKSSPYVNEPITIIYKLYYKAPIRVINVQETETPKYKDFWNQDIKIPQIKIQREIYKGQDYNVVEWKKVVLYPQKSGLLEISPLSMNLMLDVPTDKRDFFDNIIIEQTSQFISTGTRRINVKQLPLDNMPSSFTGAVGEFEFDVILDKSSLRATESFQAELKVKGKGNLKLFDLPDLLVPGSMELFEPQREELINTNLSGMNGSVTKLFTVIPRFQGSFPIEQVEFSYFDPKLEKYKILKSPRLTIDVYDGPTISNPSVNNTNTISPNDSFRFIKINTKLMKINNDEFFESEIFYLLISSPFAMVIAFVILTAYKRKRKSSFTETQRVQHKEIDKMINTAKESLNDKNVFYDLIEKAVYKTLLLKFSLNIDNLNKEKIKSTLRVKGIDEKNISKIIQLIENCENAKYSRSSNSIMNNDLNTAKEIISLIQKNK